VSAFFDILNGYFSINLSSLSSKEYVMGIALKITTGEILIINFKNPRHTFVSQHLRNVQAKFHRNLPNFGTLLIHLFERRMAIFVVIFAIFFCGIKKTGNSYFFSKIYIYQALQRAFL